MNVQRGPIDPEARGLRYALSFVDDFSGFITIYFLKAKSHAVSATKNFCQTLRPTVRWKNFVIKRLRSDNESELTFKEFQTLLTEHKIKHEVSAS